MKTQFFIVMGVSGSGKTSVGQSLANRLGWDFYDSDRAPWLAALHELISLCLRMDRSGVLACSALKERYRRNLIGDHDGVQIVYLKGSYDLIWSRMQRRTDHYMKPHMLKSQFEALDEPTHALTVGISTSVDDIVQQILKQME